MLFVKNYYQPYILVIRTINKYKIGPVNIATTIEAR